MKTTLYLLALALCGLWACDSEDTNQVDIPCAGDGQALTSENQDICVYERAVVIETGFICPPEFTVLQEFEDIATCAQFELSDNNLGEVRQRYRRDNPQAAPLPVGYCSDNMPCPDDESCQMGICEPNPDPQPECTVDADCDLDEQCSEGRCIPTPVNNLCQSDADCLPDEACSDSVCAPRTPDCESDADCAPGQICASAICVSEPDLEPAACASDDDCADGQSCVDAVCTACIDNDGDGVCADDDCDEQNPLIPAPEIVDGLDNDCDGEIDEEPDALCESNADCAPGEQCASGVCL